MARRLVDVVANACDGINSFFFQETDDEVLPVRPEFYCGIDLHARTMHVCVVDVEPRCFSSRATGDVRKDMRPSLVQLARSCPRKVSPRADDRPSRSHYQAQLVVLRSTARFGPVILTRLARARVLAVCAERATEAVGSAIRVAVRTALLGGPPHRSVREELPHTAPTLGM